VRDNARSRRYRIAADVLDRWRIYCDLAGLTKPFHDSCLDEGIKLFDLVTSRPRRIPPVAMPAGTMPDGTSRVEENGTSFE
jgi:hypothetical protein